MYDSWNANFTNAQNMYNQEYGAWQDSVNNAYQNANLQLQQQGMAYDQAYNNYNALANNANNLYAQEYGAWQDSVNNAYNSANLQLQQQGQAYNQAYNTYNALADNYNTVYAQEYQKWQDMVNNAYAMAGMQNSDYWNNVDNTYRYDAMENSNQQAELDRIHDSSENELDRQHDSSENEKNRQYNSSEAEKDRQHDNSQFVARYDVNGDGVVDYKDQAVEEDKTDSYKEPTETQKQKALEAYNTGGDDAYYQYLDSLPSNIDVESIDAYVNGDGAGNKGYGELPLEQRTFTKTDDTTNWLWGVDGDDVVQDQYGNTYEIDELPESLRKALTKLGKGESYTAK